MLTAISIQVDPMFIHVRNDDLNIVRQLKCVILRTNILMRTFSSCSVEIKLFMFKSYCSNFYCSHLWYNFTKVQMNKLRITYNNGMMRLFNLHFRCSASEMFADCNIHSMDEMIMTCRGTCLRRTPLKPTSHNQRYTTGMAD